MLNPLITSQTKQRERESEKKERDTGSERRRTERIRTQALSYSSKVTSKARGCHGDSAGLGKGCTYLGECGDGVANIQTQKQERVGGFK